MKILGFVAMKGSGKTTACKYLESKYGAVRVSFKDALITELKEKFPLLLEEIAKKETDITGGMFLDEAINALFETKPPLIRRLMQEYGTNVRRGDSIYYWTEKYRDKVKSLPKGTLVVTDDLRFISEEDELDVLKEFKVADEVIKVRITRTDMKNTDTHQSEQEQKDIVCDYEIVCHGGDEDKLYAELDAIMQAWNKN